MSKLRFTDGVEIDTSGVLRIKKLPDGYYVVGEGYCIPVDSHADGERMIAGMRAEKKNADHIDGYDRDDLGESPDW